MPEKIFDIVKSNLKNPKLYVFLLVLAVVVLVLFPYIDANVFYYNRVNSRIEILSKMAEIDTEKINNNEILSQEYNKILSEIEKQSDGSLGSVFIKETNIKINRIKFITGGLLCWFLALLFLFLKGMKNGWHRLLGLLLFAVLGIVFGYISVAIPTIVTPLTNYIGFPLIQVILLALLVTSSKKTDKDSSTNN